MTKLIQAMSFYDTEDNISCLDERHIIILVNLHIQKSLGTLFLVEWIAMPSESFPLQR